MTQGPHSVPGFSARHSRNGGRERKPARSSMGPRSPLVGLVNWFNPNDRQRVEELLADMRLLGLHHLRTGISWADYAAGTNDDWYAWLFPRLAEEVSVLPCFLYTPPSLGIEPKISSPPRRPEAYASFIQEITQRFGSCFDWVELWNDPNNRYDWDWWLDPDWHVFCEMIRCAARSVHAAGKKAVLAGMCPTDPHWLQLMSDQKVLSEIDALGIHGFPGTWEFDWDDWGEHIRQIRGVLDQCGSDAEIWITKTGFSTWRHDEHQQLRAFLRALAAPVPRIYWYADRDLDPDMPTQDGLHADERHYHFGLRKPDGTPKLLFRLWTSDGPQAVREASQFGRAATVVRRRDRPVLITGGAGFIGSNLAHRLLEQGKSVLIFDNLSRRGVEENLRWLRRQHGDRVQVMVGDVRDRYMLRRAVKSAVQVFHLAAQVAVTTSLLNPSEDFAINAQGTLNLLEELRLLNDPAPMVFTSTNKVYGSLKDIELVADGRRYKPASKSAQEHGVSECQPLDLYSPYGCSKGVADQYVLDYSRTFGLPAVVFRMSCIYGPHQFGTEDQGWVAHFLIRALRREPITLYGDGLQVRDLLFVDDLVNAFLLAQSCMPRIAGQAFNIGGGVQNAISLLDLLELIDSIQNEKPAICAGTWRVGDQRYYVSDIGRFHRTTGWSPRVSVREGVCRLNRWLVEYGLNAIHDREEELTCGMR